MRTEQKENNMQTKITAPHGALEDQNQFFALKAIPAAKRTPNQDARLAFLKKVIVRSPSRLALLAETMGSPMDRI